LEYTDAFHTFSHLENAKKKNIMVSDINIMHGPTCHTFSHLENAKKKEKAMHALVTQVLPRRMQIEMHGPSCLMCIGR
jgi:hydrogenase maturation factor